jgi:hypothetical protein
LIESQGWCVEKPQKVFQYTTILLNGSGKVRKTVCLRRTIMDQNRVHFTRVQKGVLLLVIMISMFFSGGWKPSLPVKADNVQQALTRKIYLPVIGVGATGTDLLIQRVEVTQGVQDTQNGVPLVAGRTTMLRIYAQTISDSKLSATVNVSIAPRRAGVMLSAAPYQVAATLGPSSSPEIYASTVNIPVPAEWLSGSYELVVTLDPQNLVPESNEANNTFVVRLNFQSVPALRITIVPISYTSSETGVTYPAPTQDTISAYIQRLYPVSNVVVTWHAPFAFRGNMKEISGFSTLLGQINDLKKLEGAPASQVYYALVPTRNGASSWFNGGLVGLGYIGIRTAVGLDYSNAGATAAHEIGHNLGRYHAPCGGASSPDSQYPYAGASIGHYGLDISTGTLFGPVDGKDVMSYCSPKWISDYTYKALFNAQLLQAPDESTEMTGQVTGEASESKRPVWMVRAQVGSEGARFSPVYAVTARPDPVPVEGAYRLQWIGLDGIVVAEIPVEAVEIAQETEDGPQLFDIQALVEMPDAPVQGLRLLHEGVVLAEQAIKPAGAGPDLHVGSLGAAAAAGMEVMVEETQENLKLSWDGLDSVMVRASKDGGQTWTILGMDVPGNWLMVDLAWQGSLFEVLPSSSIQ